jgi:hypothetical protein
MPAFDQPGDVLRGACLCGAVAYRAQGPLFATSHCFCTQCQRQHGAAAGTYGNVASGGFVIERGAERITTYAKSAAGHCGFCSTCGTMLYWRGNATPERVALALGVLQPAWTGHVERDMFTEHKPAWLPPA